MSKIVKYLKYDEENVFLTADQSFAILKEKRLYHLDIRCSTTHSWDIILEFIQYLVQDPGETRQEGEGGAAPVGLETGVLHPPPGANQAGLLL